MFQVKVSICVIQIHLCLLVAWFKRNSVLFQQLEVITPFQIYFNPDLILRHFQVSSTQYLI